MRIHVVFISTGLIFLVCGMAFGIWMEAREHFTYADAHAHWNLLGFVVPTIYGLVHHAYPNLARSRLAWPQCIAHFVGVLILVAGLMVFIRTGSSVVVIPGAILVLLATLTYAALFFTSNRDG
jgi:hypothetical protein